jgi:hypothetical protein
VGEIGRDRLEYLYDMSYCEILLIQRGYRRRNILQYQLQRLQAYGAFHCMSGGNGETPDDWLPMYFDRYITDEDDAMPLQKDQVARIVAEIDAINAQRGTLQEKAEE